MARKAIFVGYRREDAADVAGRIYDVLSKRFGRGRIFKDVDDLRPGTDFGDEIKSYLRRCRVALVLIGPHWLEMKDERGERRIDDANDWVRIEIETALDTKGLEVIPVLLNGARLPRAEELPESLRPLVSKHAAIIRRDPDFHDDARRLLDALRDLMSGGVPRPRDAGAANETTSGRHSIAMRGVGAVAIGLGLIALTFGYLQFWPRSDATSSIVHPVSNSPREFNYSGDGGWTPQMVVVPGGEFTMGAADDEPGGTGPQHPVRVSEFAVSKYEITFDLWQACVERGGCTSNPNPNDEGWGRGNRPVINVSLQDAREYVDWLSGATGQAYRLLSESEWEYAARAGTTTAFSTGPTISVAQANFNPSDLDPLDPGYVTPDGQTRPVGSYPANPFGLHDMHGNVAEWVEDCWNADYYGAPIDGAPWLGGECRLNPIRGGSWFDSREALQSARRYAGVARRGAPTMGFRVARTLTDE